MSHTSEPVKNSDAANHLINEISPYLLQHAHNPVDWYPWSKEALSRAEKEDKPIFLSIGYAACHWCHVMERESFENEEIASILNENFISIKVDREERPDLDQIYMSATLSMTGSGGWPMTVFLTPDLKPFFAGTYFPPEDKYGRPGFKGLLTKIATAFRTDREKIKEYSAVLTEALAKANRSNGKGDLEKSVIGKAAQELIDNYDRTNGGFGGAPKFPHATELSFLLKAHKSEGKAEFLQAVEHTLKSMGRGGIYDQIGGGFHRYSVDARWLVPHFEKMLYDNALLAVTYSETFQITGDDFYKKIATGTLDFILSEMAHDKGGFYSSLDADSEGQEGKFYIWTKSEIDALLADRAEIFCRYFNVTESGNFEKGSNILNIDSSSDSYIKLHNHDRKRFEQSIEESRQILFEARAKRTRPGTDDKILTSWNGLAISGLAKEFQITLDEKYRQAALKTAEFIRDALRGDDILHHTYRNGQVSHGPFLEDYAYFINGLIDLYEIAADYKWIELALELSKQALQLFSDDDGNLYLSPGNSNEHYIRPRDITDGALPAPGSIFMQALLRLADITGHDALRAEAERLLKAIAGEMASIPRGMISAITALNYLFSDRAEIVLVGKTDRRPFLTEIYGHYLPNRIIIISESGKEGIPLLEGRDTDEKMVAYVCRNSTCELPAYTPLELKEQLGKL